MRDLSAVQKLVPPIEPLALERLPAGSTYIGAAGFEDRALSVLEQVKASGLEDRLERAIAIEYRPANPRNRRTQFEQAFAAVGLTPDRVTWAVYDRYQPGEFAETLTEALDKSSWGSHILLDMSAMSKLLIVLLAEALCGLPLPLTVGYGEAETYHPTRDEYEKDKDNIPEAMPGFLTTDVYKIVTTNSVSSVAMHAYPLMMLAFPTFNYNEMVALVNELTPQHFVLLEGIPHEEHNVWRLEAIQYINRAVRGEALEIHSLSTFEYVDTVRKLEEIYSQYQYTHKIIIAPTGSKFQTLGVWLFKQMHPDVQIIYPVTRDFSDTYSDGCKALWQIQFADFARFATELGNHRRGPLEILKGDIAAAERQTSD